MIIPPKPTVEEVQEPINLLAEQAEEKLAEESEDILREQTLESAEHLIPYEELERLRDENCIYAVTIPAGTELEYMAGCTLIITEERTLVAVKYGERYYLCLPFYGTLCVEHPEGLERTAEVNVSPNTVFTAEEDMILPIAQDELSEYLAVEELFIEKGAECHLDLLYTRGIGHLCGDKGFSVTEEQAEIRPMGQNDLAVVWYEKGAENPPDIEAGQVVYRLLKDDTDGDVLVGGGHNPAETVPDEMLYSVNIEELKATLPVGEYAFITYGNYCSIAPENSRLGLVRAENKIGERNETVVYFEVE